MVDVAAAPFLFHRVVGVPGAQGSKRHVGGGRMIESSKKVGPWREAVAAQLVAACSTKFGDAAVRLTVEFVLTRPQSMSAKKPTPHCTKTPDIDKCVRSTCDAISIAGIWGDDKNVCELVARKRTAEPGEATGAMIMIEALEPKEISIGKTEKQQPAKRAGRGDGQRRGRARAAQPAGDGSQYFV